MLPEDVVSGERALRNCEPWINPVALKCLTGIVRRNWRIFEWGSGASTVWWAKRCSNIITVDHSAKWHRWVRRETKRLGLRNVKAVLRKGCRAYCQEIRNYRFRFHCVVVDGEHRPACLEAARGCLKPGGVLLLDDSQRYEIPKWLRTWEKHVVDSPPFLYKGEPAEWQAAFFYSP